MSNNATERFEKIARLFYHDTGFLRPGKDVPAIKSTPSYDEERQSAWENWVAQNRDRIEKESGDV